MKRLIAFMMLFTSSYGYSMEHNASISMFRATPLPSCSDTFALGSEPLRQQRKTAYEQAMQQHPTNPVLLRNHLRFCSMMRCELSERQNAEHAAFSILDAYLLSLRTEQNINTRINQLASMVDKINKADPMYQQYWAKLLIYLPQRTSAQPISVMDSLDTLFSDLLITKSDKNDLLNQVRMILENNNDPILKAYWNLLYRQIKPVTYANTEIERKSHEKK